MPEFISEEWNTRRCGIATLAVNRVCVPKSLEVNPIGTCPELLKEKCLPYVLEQSEMYLRWECLKTGSKTKQC